MNQQHIHQQHIHSTGKASLKRATAGKTRRAMSGVRVDDRSAAYLQDIANSDLEDPVDIHTMHGYPEPKPPGTEVALPPGKGIVYGKDEPEWCTVKDLPGYMSSAIRAIGRQVFSPITSQPIEDIEVIANLNGSGPNSDREINTVLSYLRRNGTRQTEAEIEFNQNVLRGYMADVQIWRASGIEFMVVKDHAGKYIYAWPKNTSKNFDPSRARLSTPKNRLR